MMHYWINIGLFIVLILVTLILVFKSVKTNKIIQILGVIILAAGIFLVFFPLNPVENPNPATLYLVGTKGKLPDSINVSAPEIKVVYEDSAFKNNLDEVFIDKVRVLNPWKDQYKLRSLINKKGDVTFTGQSYSEPPFFTEYYPSQNNEWSFTLSSQFNYSYDSIIIHDSEEEIFRSKLPSDSSDLTFTRQFTSPGPVILNFKFYKNGLVDRESKSSFNVRAASYPRIALFTGHPNSEFNTLLRWLEKENYEYFYRTEISKERYINKKVGKIDPYVFNNEWLDQFDLFIISSDAFNSYQWSMLTNMVLQKGKGLIITGDDKRGVNISLNYLGGEVTAYWQEGERNPYQISLNNRQVLVKKSDLRALRSVGTHFSIFKDTDLTGFDWPYFITGTGRVTVIPFEKTYDIILKGEEKIYSSLWKTFIDKISFEKKTYPDFLNYPYISVGKDEEILIIDQTNEEIRNSESTKLSYLPYLSILSKDVNDKGWGHLTDSLDHTNEIYVYDQEWPEFELLQNKIETLQTIQAHNKILSKNDVLISIEKQPGWISLILILTGLILMWSGPKI